MSAPPWIARRLPHLSAPWRRTSLKLRLTALIVALFVASIWIIVLISATVLEEHLERLLADQQVAMTAQLAAQLDKSLKDNIDGLNRAAAGLPPTLSQATLAPLLAQRPLMHVAFAGGLLVVDLEGKAIADYPSLGRHGTDYGQRDWFRGVVASGKPYIGKPLVEPALARPVLTLAVPVLDGAGRLRAVLSGGIDLSGPGMLDLVTDKSLTGVTEYFVVSRRDRLFVAAADPVRTLTPTPERGRNLMFDRMLDGFEGAGIAFSSAGVAKLYAGKRVASADWLVIAALPTQIAFSPVRTMHRYLQAFALLLTLVAAVLIGLVLRRMLAPLEDAAQAIGHMTAGERELAPLPVRRNDEVGAVVRNFNHLVVDRLEYEEALLESERRFRLLVEGAPDAIFIQSHGAFAYANAAAVALLGAASAAELLGRPVIERIPAEDHARVLERIRRVNEERRSFSAVEQTFLRMDGSRVAVEVAAVPYAAGETHGAIVFARDIDDKKRAAAELDRYRGQLEDLVATRTAELTEAKQAAEAATRAKSEFLSTMSHEIRTPLGIIVGLGEVLLQKLHEPVLRKRLEQLCGTAEHLGALVSDILDLSKIDAGHLALEEDDFRLGTVLDSVTRLTAELAGRKGLELVVEATAELRELPLRGDALRLTQVLINLAGNAVKFTEQGSVFLSVSVLANAAASRRLRFAVRDTGIGIAAADCQRVFQAFEQADGRAMRGGTGLGLAISQRLVALMGGRIELQSTPGAGSTFSFELAFAPGGAAGGEASPQPAPIGHARVLVADDHPINQEIILDLLETLGCEAEIAGDGAEAVECARGSAYDLILMDVRMPRMDGLAATRAIRALPQHRATPILAVTANAFSEDRQSCLDAGMNGYIGKPFTLATLAEALREWLPQASAPALGAARADDSLSLDADCLFRQTLPDPAAYAALLRRFALMHEFDMARVREHLAAGDREGARQIVHKLKGAAGLVGAAGVSPLAAEMEAALRAGADAAALVPLAARCAEELARLAAAMRALPAAALA